MQMKRSQSLKRELQRKNRLTFPFPQTSDLKADNEDDRSSNDEEHELECDTSKMFVFKSRLK